MLFITSPIHLYTTYLTLTDLVVGATNSEAVSVSPKLHFTSPLVISEVFVCYLQGARGLQWALLPGLSSSGISERRK